jgi:hypothetical protein
LLCDEFCGGSFVAAAGGRACGGGAAACACVHRAEASRNAKKREWTFLEADRHNWRTISLRLPSAAMAEEVETFAFQAEINQVRLRAARAARRRRRGGGASANHH